MPLIIWRYILNAYLKVFLFAVSGFVMLLLLIRLKEIARFIAIASSFFDFFKFVVYQIPHILPIAIPISSLISALLLLQNLSHKNELTAMRANGISLKKIIKPILFTSFVMSTVNFFICSELTTKCSIKTKEILYEQSTLNPIQLLQRQNLTKSHAGPLHLENFFVDMKGSVSNQYAKEVVLILSDPKKNGLYLVTADKFSIDGDILNGEKVSIASAISNKPGNTLLLQTHNQITTKASDIAALMKSKSWHSSMKYYDMATLVKKAKKEPLFPKKKAESFKVEIIRRLFLGLSAFTFAFIGFCFGLEISRVQNKKKMLLPSLLSLMVLLSFIVGKAFKYNHLLAALFFILPQPFAILLSIFKLKKISRGVE